MPIADGKLRLGDRFALPDPATWQPPVGWQPDAEAKLYDFSPHTSFFQTMGHYDLPRFREGGLTVQAMAIFIERANRRGLISNIYKGRVSRVLPGMQAAFIDIGLERTAFLHASDIVQPGRPSAYGVAGVGAASQFRPNRPPGR